MGKNSKYEQVQLMQSKRLETAWDQLYPQGFFDPGQAKKVWEGDCGNGKERLYLTKYDNWIIEEVDVFGRAHSWLAMLSDKERGDLELNGEF